MNITYNNITIPFYSNILELIEKSPYRDVAKRDVILDVNGIPKTVVVSLSGGADSCSALYLTAKLFPQIEVYPLTFRDVNAPADADAAAAIVKFIQKEFPKAKINDITTYSYNDRDKSTYERAQKMIESEPEYSQLNLVQMSKTMQLDDGNNRFMKQFKGPVRLDGMTSNPPIAIRQSFANEMVRRHPDKNFTPFELQRVQGEPRRDSYQGRPEFTYNVYQPFVSVDKKFVADIFKKHDLMHTLYPITRSCVGGAGQTQNFTKWCHQCFWCYEKKWAFDLEWEPRPIPVGLD
jgi:7-cyano-7-deazaguanine synthase in queuosine biosynthesis